MQSKERMKGEEGFFYDEDEGLQMKGGPLPSSTHRRFHLFEWSEPSPQY